MLLGRDCSRSFGILVNERSRSKINWKVVARAGPPPLKFPMRLVLFIYIASERRQRGRREICRRILRLTLKWSRVYAYTRPNPSSDFRKALIARSPHSLLMHDPTGMNRRLTKPTRVTRQVSEAKSLLEQACLVCQGRLGEERVAF